MPRLTSNALIYASFLWIVSQFSLSEVGLKMKPGEDVVLKCQTPRGASIELLELIRPDLLTDGYVLFYRNNRVYEKYQHPSFRGRVELRDPQMKDGDVSVVLKNVNVNDTGTYECRVFVTSVGGERAGLTEFTTLTVTDAGDGETKDEAKTDDVTKDEGDKHVNVGVVVGLTVLCLCLVVGLVFSVKCLKKNKYHLPPGKTGPQPPV